MVYDIKYIVKSIVLSYKNLQKKNIYAYILRGMYVYIICIVAFL